jgi:addiction module RelE/StbE family toxin
VKVRWTEDALEHLHEAYDYIHMDKPSAAARMADLIEAAATQLGFFPEMGRLSKRQKTRELAVPGSPFILVYRGQNAAVEILALYRGAQNWQRRL